MFKENFKKDQFNCPVYLPYIFVHLCVCTYIIDYHLHFLLILIFMILVIYQNHSLLPYVRQCCCPFSFHFSKKYQKWHIVIHLIQFIEKKLNN